MTDDPDTNLWDQFLPLLVVVASACVAILMLTSTYVLARYLLGLG